MGVGTEREFSSRLPAKWGDWCGAQSHDPWYHDLSQHQDSDAQSTEPHRHPKTIFIPNDDILNTFQLKAGEKQRCPFVLLFNIVLAILAYATRHIKENYIAGKEE